MTDYITLTINEGFLEYLIIFSLMFLLILMILNLIDMIIDTKKRNKQDRLERIAKPYKEEYERLREKDLQEASDYYEKNKKYINYGNYY